MDGPGVKAIIDTAVASVKPSILTCDREPRDTYFIAKPDGSVEKFRADAAPRAYTAHGVSSIINMVTHFASTEPEKSFVVFCGRGRVQIVFDEAGTRRDRVTLQVPDSKRYQLLTQLENNRNFMEQRDLVSMLRVEFAGAIPSDFVSLMRQLKFTDNQTSEGTLAAGKESLGGAVLREAIAGGRDMPEEVTFRLPVYEDLVGKDGSQFEASIVAVVDVNLAEKKIRLIPKPPELLAARRHADTWLYTQLTTLAKDLSNVRVFEGCA